MKLKHCLCGLLLLSSCQEKKIDYTPIEIEKSLKAKMEIISSTLRSPPYQDMLNNDTTYTRYVMRVSTPKASYHLITRDSINKKHSTLYIVERPYHDSIIYTYIDRFSDGIINNYYEQAIIQKEGKNKRLTLPLKKKPEQIQDQYESKITELLKTITK